VRDYADVEGLYDAAYGSEEEALIAERHDPKVIIKDEPCYEIHFDLVNDLWLALLELDTIYWYWISICWAKKGNYVAVEDYSETSLAAYTVGRGLAEAAKTWADYGRGDGMEEMFGYWMYVRGDAVDEYMTGVGGWGGEIVDEFRINLRMPVADGLPGLLPGRIWLQMGWRGREKTDSLPVYKYVNCEFGFEEETMTGVPDDLTWEYKYIPLETGALDSDTSEDYYYVWYHGDVLSPWPETEASGHMDFIYDYPDTTIRWISSQIEVKVPIDGAADIPSVFELDWEKVPKGIFDEDDSNAIEV